MAEETETSMSIGAEEKVGSYLRRIREARGIDAEQLAESIRLGKNVVQDIEANRWENFSTEAYLRSYIISICEKLHVDKKVVIDKFSQETNSHFRVAQSNIITDSIQEQEREKEKSSVPKIAIVLIVIIVAIFFFVNNAINKDPNELEPATQAQTQTEEVKTEDTVDTVAVKDSLAKADTTSTQLKKDTVAVDTAKVTAINNTETETKQDSLRFECIASPTDNTCGVTLKGLDSKMRYFKRFEKRVINRSDTAQITITVPERTRLFINNKRLEYGKYNTLLFFDGKIVSKKNRDLR